MRKSNLIALRKQNSFQPITSSSKSSKLIHVKTPFHCPAQIWSTQAPIPKKDTETHQAANLLDSSSSFLSSPSSLSSLSPSISSYPSSSSLVHLAKNTHIRPQIHTLKKISTFPMDPPKKDLLPSKYFSVFYCKKSSKKHKTYFDGLIIVKGTTIELKDEESKVISKKNLFHSLDHIAPTSEIDIGRYELEVISEVSSDEYLSGRVFLNSSFDSRLISESLSRTLKPTPLKAKQFTSDLCLPMKVPMKSLTFKKTQKKKKRKNDESSSEDEQNVSTPVVVGKPFTSVAPSAVFLPDMQPLVYLGAEGGSFDPKSPPSLPIPRHDPDSPDALILNRSKKSFTNQFTLNHCSDLTPKPSHPPNESIPIYPIVVDPFIARKLRPHQRDGVTFLCISSMQSPGYYGAILADEMGLGKTLQIITLIWTLLKDGPKGRPMVSKVIIVCPTTLINNWEKEFVKWLGRERLVPRVIGSDQKPQEQKQHLLGFLNCSFGTVLILGYELFRRHVTMLSQCPIDLMVCDEGFIFFSLTEHGKKISNNLPDQGIDSRAQYLPAPKQ